jgi:hypothetical protein
MAAIRLDYLVFYIGNLSYGFDYVYAKRSEGHAFLVRRAPHEDIADINDPEFDFFNPHLSEDRKTTFNWNYDEKYTNMTNVWEHFVDVSLGFIEDWSDDYRGVSLPNDSQNVEWGIRFKSPNYPDEQIVWGINAYPDRFDDFVAYLRSFDASNPTPQPQNLPFTKGKYNSAN